MTPVSLPLLATTSLILTPLLLGLVCQAAPLPSSHISGRESSQSPAFEAQRPTSPVTPTYLGHPLAPFGSSIISEVNRDNDMSHHRVEESESSSEHPHQVAQNVNQVVRNNSGTGSSSITESVWPQNRKVIEKNMEEKIVNEVARLYSTNTKEAYRILSRATGQDGEDLVGLFGDTVKFKAKVAMIKSRLRSK